MSDPAPSVEEVERDILEALGWWMTPSVLAVLASKRAGFASEGYGMRFPENLDEYDRETLRIHVPAGHVEVFGFHGNPDGGFRHIVPEPVYLTVLARHLKELGRTGDAEAVEKLILVRRL